ncbi:MAG TPA: SPASM domain-containing protein, partial [Methylomirabilota bacterium]|nr:SPASM domain-containing protein [Methylomirabilota bacterium]
LVIEPDGSAVPLTYGFPRVFALGDIRTEPLHALAARWREERYPSFRNICRAVYRRLVSRKRAVMVNWYELVAKAAAREASPVRGDRAARRSRRPRRPIPTP